MKKNIENKKPSFILLIILLGFPQLHEAMFSPSIKSIASEYLISIEKAQSVLSVYFIAFAIGVLIWGYFSDRYGRKPALIWGFLVFVVGALIVLLAPTFKVFMLGRIIVALGLATGSVTTQTILREAFEPKVRNKLFSQVSIALAFVPGIGPMLGGAFVDNLGIKFLFSFLLMVGVFLIIITYVKLPETRTEVTQQDVNIYTVFKRMLLNKNVWIYGFFIAVFNAIMSIYYMEVPILFTEHYGMSLATVGSFGFSLAVATILGATCTQILLKRYEPKIVILIGNLVLLLGTIIMLLVGLVIPAELIGAYLYIFGMFIVRFGTAISLSNAISLSLNGFEDVYGTAGSLLSLGYYAGISLLIKIMTHLRTGSLTVMPLYFMTLTVIMILLTWNVIKDK